MHDIDTLIGELWKRMSNVSGVNRTALNPAVPPAIDDFPVIQIFELDNSIIRIDRRGCYPIYTRKLILYIETYLTGSEEALSTKELHVFIKAIKKKIYEGGNNLGNTCTLITETGSSRVLRPPIGENSIGKQLQFEILYIENTSQLY